MKSTPTPKKNPPSVSKEDVKPFQVTGFEAFSGYNTTASYAAMPSSGQGVSGFEAFFGFNMTASYASIPSLGLGFTGFEAFSGQEDSASGTPVKKLSLQSTRLSNGDVVFKNLGHNFLAPEHMSLFAEEYAKNKYPSSDEMRSMASKFGLTYIQLKRKYKEHRGSRRDQRIPC